MAYPSLDPLLWQPVAAGMWRQHELYDGTYDVVDLLHMVEFLTIKDENARRRREVEMRDAKRG